MAALSEKDLERVSGLVTDLQIVRFHCGHGIHFEKVPGICKMSGKTGVTTRMSRF